MRTARKKSRDGSTLTEEKLIRIADILDHFYTAYTSNDWYKEQMLDKFIHSRKDLKIAHNLSDDADLDYYWECYKCLRVMLSLDYEELREMIDDIRANPRKILEQTVAHEATA